MSSSRRALLPTDQLDFWPELRSNAMVGCATLAGARAPARRDEDGRAGASAVRGERLGNPALNPDSFCPPPSALRFGKARR